MPGLTSAARIPDGRASRRRFGRIISRSLLWLALSLLLIWSFGPVLYVITSSLKLPMKIWSFPPKLFDGLSLDNYRKLATVRPEFFADLKNSIIISAGTCVLTLLCSLPAAFVFSRFRGRILKGSAFFLIAVRMIPPIVIGIPLFPLCNSLGLVDTHALIVVLYSAFLVSLCTWILKTFVDDIPKDLEESAMIDGCSQTGAFFKIILPLLKPGLFAVIIFSAEMAWNDFETAFIFSATRSRTVPVTLSDFMGSFMGVEWGLLLSAAVLHLAPIMILTLVMQKYLVRGMTLGALK